MSDAERFVYLPEDSATPAPFVPLRLSHGGVTLEASGLLDTGAAVNVLPFSLGTQLGLDWDRHRAPLRLTGNMAAAEAQGVTIMAMVGSFPPRRLAFAWTRAEGVPLILGQINFFQEFHVCFFRSRRYCEIRLGGDLGV